MRNYAPPKSRESQLWEFWDSHLGIPRQKSIWMWPPVERCKVYYKGKGAGLPQVRAMVSLVSRRLPVARPNTKSAPTML